MILAGDDNGLVVVGMVKNVIQDSFRSPFGSLVKLIKTF